MATADQVDTRAEMIAQLDEQIAALDLKMRHLQRGGTALMMSSNLIKATELAADRRRLADERARLAGEGRTAPAATSPSNSRRTVASATLAATLAMTARGGIPTVRGCRRWCGKNILKPSRDYISRACALARWHV